MELYGLTSFELLWEQERDTKALLAWSDDTVVLAFRGTASLRNVIADIQARRSGLLGSLRGLAVAAAVCVPNGPLNECVSLPLARRFRTLARTLARTHARFNSGKQALYLAALRLPVDEGPWALVPSVTSQMWRVPHPPARGSRMLSTRPYVHAGFLRSWTAQGFSDRLTARVRDIVAAMPLKGRRARVYVTGA